MKSAVKVLVLFTLFWAVLALAQTYTNPTFKHVIIVIQENRTPDNLFGAYTQTGYSSTLPQLGPGYDIKPATGAQQWCLGTCFNPGHANSDWLDQYNTGNYNSCLNAVTTSQCGSGNATCDGQTVCIGNGCMGKQMPPTPCGPQDSYVSPTNDDEFYTNPDPQHPSWTSPLVPYFDIAAKYGFANYFFQTNQGPSQPAHDFLFGGTSAPTGTIDQSNYFQILCERQC